uniref:Putative outcast ele5 orf2-h 1e-60-j 4 n=1 Tax=Ixodes ricinus TaxID=34613 RepID=A0A0K8RN56_IXORI
MSVMVDVGEKLRSYLLQINLAAFDCIASICLISPFRYGSHTTQPYSKMNLIRVLYAVILTSLVEDFKVLLTYPSLCRAREQIELMCLSHFKLGVKKYPNTCIHELDAELYYQYHT